MILDFFGSPVTSQSYMEHPGKHFLRKHAHHQRRQTRSREGAPWQLGLQPGVWERLSLWLALGTF